MAFLEIKDYIYINSDNLVSIYLDEKVSNNGEINLIFKSVNYDMKCEDNVINCSEQLGKKIIAKLKPQISSEFIAIGENLIIKKDFISIIFANSDEKIRVSTRNGETLDSYISDENGKLDAIANEIKGASSFFGIG